MEASTVYDEGKTGLNDRAQLEYASILRAVIFTHDPDFIEIAQEMNHRGEDHYGLIFVEMHRLGLGECIRRLALYAEVVTAEEMMNRIEFL